MWVRRVDWALPCSAGLQCREAHSTLTDYSEEGISTIFVLETEKLRHREAKEQAKDPTGS